MLGANSAIASDKRGGKSDRGKSLLLRKQRNKYASVHQQETFIYDLTFQKSAAVGLRAENPLKLESFSAALPPSQLTCRSFSGI
jgi:hypothetical protein